MKKERNVAGVRKDSWHYAPRNKHGALIGVSGKSRIVRRAVAALENKVMVADIATGFASHASDAIRYGAYLRTTPYFGGSLT